MPTQERLKELLHYDTDTGVFTNIKPRKKINVGDIAGSNDKYGYLIIGIDGKPQKAHRLAFLYIHGRFPDLHLDHINGVKDDNRIVNLREVTHRENLQNQKKHPRTDISIPTGVMVVKSNGVPIAYRAQWQDISGKPQSSPSFNFIKYGSRDKAIQKAIEYRKEKISELNEQGSSYTNRHGLNLTF